jgi:hypothetical protein
MSNSTCTFVSLYMVCYSQCKTAADIISQACLLLYTARTTSEAISRRIYAEQNFDQRGDKKPSPVSGSTLLDEDCDSDASDLSDQNLAERITVRATGVRFIVPTTAKPGNVKAIRTRR